jgi:AcrR family transcriptional regulator
MSSGGISFPARGGVIDSTMGLREEKKVEQRHAILGAAVALFRKRGYEQTRVQDIIARLRISEATFFNYFPTKEALLYEFAVEDIERSSGAIRAELERHDRSVPDRIRSLMSNWVLGWASDRQFNALVVNRSRLLAGPKGELREKALRNYDLLAQLFREGQERGEIRADMEPLQLAEILEGIFVITAGNWLFQWWKDSTGPLDERLMRAVNVFLDGCKPTSRGVTRAVGANRAVETNPATRPRRRNLDRRTALTAKAKAP